MGALLSIIALDGDTLRVFTSRIPSMEACAAQFVGLANQFEAATGYDWQQVSCIALVPWQYPL